MQPIPLDQHNSEIHENRRHWDRKPLIHDIYGEFYGHIRVRLSQVPGEILELGSGMGNVKQHIPACVTSDIFHNPWLDRIENAYALTCAPRSVSNLILMDVFHHLKHPGLAFREFERVMKPGGRVMLFEPAMGLMGRAIYGLGHHEPLGLGNEIAWDAPASFDPSAHDYYAAQGNCWRCFRRGQHRLSAAWNVREVKVWSYLSYTMSGGLRGPQLYPRKWRPLLKGMEKVLDLCPALTASRMLVCLEWQPGNAGTPA